MIKNRWPICNNDESSAPIINGKPFALCWRCSGGIVGIALFRLMSFIGGLNLSVYEIIILLVIGTIDYYGGKFRIWPPNNLRRFITGVFVGISIASIFYKM